jgi:hypothetical protein
MKENSMRLVCGLAILSLGYGLLGQAPKDRPAAKENKADSAAVKSTVDRLMAFDKNKDGKLEKDEITDRRLLRLFDRADANKDGVVTKEELTELATRMAEETPAGGRGGFGPPGGGPGGPGGFGPPGRGPGGPGGRGPGGFGPPPTPGQVLPPFLQERLKLTAEQKKQLDELQKEVETKLGKILTEEQNKQLKDMRRMFGRGGPGGPPGRGPGGPPPGEGDGPPPPPR